tara:strand:+ start:68 stop:229 length:162 start_codon:yes stop_codon:yes gene_type:complete
MTLFNFQKIDNPGESQRNKAAALSTRRCDFHWSPTLKRGEQFLVLEPIALLAV